ncbi:chloride channel [Gorgonomyces haynaldii]|nr:chloride channel [Gorgonomyces haynaldii]
MSTGSIRVQQVNETLYQSSDERRRTWSPRNISPQQRQFSWSRNRQYDEQDQSAHGMRWFYQDYTTIDWIHDYVKDRIRQRELREGKGLRFMLIKYADAIQAWFVLFLVGILAGCAASFLDISTAILEDMRIGYCSQSFLWRRDACPHFTLWSDSLGSYGAWAIYVLFSILFASISTFIVAMGPYSLLVNTHHSTDKPERVYHAAGSGIPQVKTILGGFVIRGFLGLRTLIVKWLALIFSISAGLMVGIQGPLVHISCAIGNVTSRLFSKYKTNEARRREILSASCAAGVSVAFGAPIGGVLFSLEEVSYYFPLKTMWRSFFCALIAAVTVKLINPLGTGKLVMFQVNFNRDWQFFELVPFMLLGLCGGLFGGVFVRSMKWMDALNKKSSILSKPFSQVILITLLTSVLSFMNPFTMMGNTALVADLFSECLENDTSRLCTTPYATLLWELFCAMLMSMILMIITFRIRVPGGVFIPSMVVGATMGRMFGIVLQEMDVSKSFCDKPCIVPGVYALVGAAATLSGVTRMTVSLTVIMFELTGALNYVLPLMVSIMVAKWVGDAFGKDSVYDKIIEQQGYPYLNSKRILIPYAATAEQLMTNDTTLTSDMEYETDDLQQYLSQLAILYPGRDGGFPIVNKDRMLVGYIAQTDLEHALDLCDDDAIDHVIFSPTYPTDARDLWHWVDKAPMTVSHLASAEVVLELFLKLGIRTLLVVRDGSFAGVIHKKRMLLFMKKAITP